MSKKRDGVEGLSRSIHELVITDQTGAIFMDIIKADYATQEAWLLKLFPNETIDDLIGRAYSDAYGVYFIFDQSRLDDMLAYPSEYDLGETIRGRLNDLDNDRVKAIENGAPLTASELGAVKGCVLEEQELGDGGCFCSGLDVNLPSGQRLFASFVGQSEGQGGIGYKFDGLFPSQRSAEKFYKKLGDHWLEL